MDDVNNLQPNIELELVTVSFALPGHERVERIDSGRQHLPVPWWLAMQRQDGWVRTEVDGLVSLSRILIATGHVPHGAIVWREIAR